LGESRGLKSGAPRERLLDTAGKLFFRHGFQAVGIDRILAESGVAKMTLYRHFPSKDALIEAYLERADGQFWAWAEVALARGKTPEDKLRCLFDAVAVLATSPECLGCVFQGAAMAFPEMDHPGHRRALGHKLEVRERLASLAREARLRAPDDLAAQLALVMDGAWIAARMFGSSRAPGQPVVTAARALIEAHRHPRPPHRQRKNR
jgi:AcrR family transcriptional regulator